MTDTTINFREVPDEKIKQYGDKIGVDWDNIKFEEFKKGCIVEMEHDTGTTDTDVVEYPLEIAKIALVHLQESPDYYVGLEKMENELENKSNENTAEYSNEQNGKCGDDCKCKMTIKQLSDEKEEEITPQNSPKIQGGGLLRILQSIVPLIFKIHNEIIPSEMENVEDNPFEVLNDDDFDDKDSVVQHFKNDLGGCKGVIKIIHTKEPDSIEQFANIISELHTIRKADRLKTFREIYASMSLAKQGRAIARSQVSVIDKLERLAADANDLDEYSTLQKAKAAVLTGTSEMFDAAAYRIQKVFASYVPKGNIRVAYTTLNTQNNEPCLMCPKSQAQIGVTIPMESSKCRNNCIDSRTTKDGKVTCAYVEWMRLADNYESLNSRFEVHHPADNKENLLTLNKSLDEYKGEHFKPLKDFEKNWEERLEKNGRTDVPEESIETQLDKAKESALGHHGEPKKSVVDVLEKKAANSKSKRIEPEKDETLGEQIEQDHKDNDYDDETIESMLSDIHVGLSEEDLDNLEEMLKDYRLD